MADNDETSAAVVAIISAADDRDPKKMIAHITMALSSIIAVTSPTKEAAQGSIDAVSSELAEIIFDPVAWENSRRFQMPCAGNAH